MYKCIWIIIILTTVNKIEIEKFSKLAKDWWNPNGKFKPLHLFNPVRIKFIREKLISCFELDPKTQLPLKKINILDIGCGGGLLCEPLKRLGATVTGIDASRNNIEIAKLHAKEMNLNINYINCSPEKLKFKNKFDVILNMEVIEHVSNVDLFIKNCSTLIEKNGISSIKCKIKTLPDYNKGHEEIISSTLKKQLGKEVSFELEYTDKIEIAKNGKIQYFKSWMSYEK